MKLETSDKLAIAAIIISLFSALFAAWGTYTVLERDFAKDRPLLRINFVAHNDDHFYGIVFSNVGQSLAIIEKVFLLTEEGGVTRANDQGWEQSLTVIGLDEVEGIRITSFESGAVIAAEERLRVVGALKEELNDSLRTAIPKLEPNLFFVICYSSIFGEKLISTSPGFENVDSEVCS